MLYIVTKNISQPLKKISIATKEIANGKLDQKIEIKSNDEIGTLADSFNQMVIALKKANQELVKWGEILEEKVKEKTKELEMAQAQLLQSEKLAVVGQLAAGVAHELNNPLSGILIYSHLLLENSNISGVDRENLEKIVREANRCKNIVKGLLDFARQTKPELKIADINDIINNVLSLVEKQALFQNIEIVKNFQSNLPMIKVDISQIQQVFINIIVNAAEAMKGYGKLTITTKLSKDNQFIEIEFTDTGCGITPENMKKLFQPFFTTKEVGKGTGLGLAISYGIIERHKGKIQVHSEVGKGTTFTIKLPINIKEEVL
jgi:two-component system NtrC family sensor kinase